MITARDHLDVRIRIAGFVPLVVVVQQLYTVETLADRVRGFLCYQVIRWIQRHAHVDGEPQRDVAATAKPDRLGAADLAEFGT